MTFSIGQQVGPYQIEQKLGQGGMATVYKAHHQALDRYVAVKVMHIALSEDETFLERFKREAQIVGKLLHPNIIPIFDYAAHENQPFLVMQYVEGQTLKQRMRRKPLTLQEVTEVVNAVASALDYAHQNDVLHRDVKPSNIMLDHAGRPYLTDFGLARIASLGESTLSTDMMLGTPQYISPEQAKGIRNLDAGTDIYSLGVVLYELVVGRVPFLADTPYTIIHDHIYKPLPLPTEMNPGVPKEVEQVLLTVLQKERSRRYESAGELAKAFAKAVARSDMEEISHHALRPESFKDTPADQRPSSAASPALTSDGIRVEIITPTPVDQQALERQSQVQSQRVNATPTTSTGAGYAVPTPTPAIPSPYVGTPSGGSVLVPGTPVNYRVERNGNGWLIGGCLTFIVMCLLSGGIVMSTMNEPQFADEWDDVVARSLGESATPENNEPPQFPGQDDGRRLGTDLRRFARNGDLTQAVLDAYVEREGTNLNSTGAQVLVHLQNNDMEAAYALIDTGFAELDPPLGAPQEFSEMMAWAELFNAAEYYHASLRMYAVTVELAQDEDPRSAETARQEIDNLFYELITEQLVTDRDVEIYAEVFPDSPNTLVAQALRFYMAEEFADADQTLAAALELAAEGDDVQVETWTAWGEIMLLYDLQEQAAEIYISALEQFPDDEDLRNAAQRILYDILLSNAQSNQLSQSQVADYDALFPDSLETEFASALILRETGDQEEAMQVLVGSASRGVRNDPSTTTIVLDWAGVFALRGFNEQALVLYLFAYLYDGDNPDVREISGSYLYDQATAVNEPNDVMMFCVVRDQLPTFAFMELVTAQALISANLIAERPFVLSRNCPGWTTGTSIESLLITAEDLTPDLAELHLIYGNYYEAREDTETAMESWERAASAESAPTWVRTRAENKMSRYE